MTSFFSLFLSLLPLLLIAFLAFVFYFLSFISFSFLCFFLRYRLASVVRMRSDKYYVQYIRGSFLGWQAVYSRFFQARGVRRTHQYVPGTS